MQVFHGFAVSRPPFPPPPFGSRFVHDALGPAFDVLVSVKQALDPHGILNPGKLGLPDPWGPPGWP